MNDSDIPDHVTYPRRGGAHITSCATCGKVIEGGPRCPTCAAEWDAVHRPTHDEDYGPEYRRNRKILLSSHPPCALNISPFCTGRGVQADHIIPISKGGTSALSNLRASCAPCNYMRHAGGGPASRDDSRRLAGLVEADARKEGVAHRIDHDAVPVPESKEEPRPRQRTFMVEVESD